MAKMSPFLLAFLLLLFLAAATIIAILIVLYIQCRTKNGGNTVNHGYIKPNGNPGHLQPTNPWDNLTLGRQQAADYLRQGLNPTVDPCQDFYHFACGNWSRNNPIPQGRRLYDTLTKLQIAVSEKVYSAIRKVDTHSSSTPSALKKVRLIFDSCTNMVEMDRHIKSIFNPLVKLLQNSTIGMWPILQVGWTASEAQMTPEELAGVLGYKYDVSTFLSPRVAVDWKQVNQHRLYLDEVDLTLGSRVFYLNNSQNSILRTYVETIEAAARTMAMDMNGFVPVMLGADIMDIVNFEVNLAEIMSDQIGTFQQSYNAYSNSELVKKFPNFDWFKYFSGLLPIDLRWADPRGPVSKVILVNPTYVQNMIALLERTPKRTVYNYLIWRLIYSRLWALSSQYRDLHRSLVETLDITKEAPPQSLQCMVLVTKVMGFAVGRLFVENNFDQSNRPLVFAMIGHVLKALESMLANSTWMDEATREKALTKARAIIANPAYPTWILNDTLLNKYYENLTVNTGNREPFFNVYNNLTSWQGAKLTYELLKPANRSLYFGYSPALTNAWYSPEHNTITLPAGILQAPVYQVNYPANLKFGGLGAILGHELTHGFDNHGVQFGPDGSLSSWFDDYSMHRFQQRAKCFVNEYNKFCYPEIKMCVNGEQTLGENLADNGGLKAAYLAYKSYVRVYGKEPAVPGLESFSNEQIFFLSYARLWCSRVDDAVLKQQLLLNPHSPDKVRVLGTLQNFPEFASAFRCSSDSPMVSKNPCSEWTSQSVYS